MMHLQIHCICINTEVSPAADMSVICRHGNVLLHGNYVAVPDTW